jgi:hypothetical protein
MSSSPASNTSGRAPSTEEGYKPQYLARNAASVAVSSQIFPTTAVQVLVDRLQAMSRRQDEMIEEMRRLTTITIHALEDRMP